MSCGCEIMRMNQDRERVRDLAKKAARMTGDTYILYQDELTKEFRFCPEQDAKNRKIIEIII
jgi:hypothetical protein